MNLSALTFPLAGLGDKEQVVAIEQYLATPDQQYDLSLVEEKWKTLSRQSPTSNFFSTTVDTTSPTTYFPPCLFHDITVPDIIGHLQDDVCWVCKFEDGHTICPGCTGGVADKFDAFMGCGVLLACPLCLGLDFMQRDKALLETYYWDPMPEEEAEARSRRFESRLKELGY